jgi:hypothetical protein
MLIDYDGIEDVLYVVREGIGVVEESFALSVPQFIIHKDSDGVLQQLEIREASTITPEEWFSSPVRIEIDADFLDAADRWINVSIESQKIFAEILEIADLVEKEDSVPTEVK